MKPDNHKKIQSTAARTMWSMSRGEHATVAALVGLSDAYQLRLKEIGVVAGASVTCINEPPLQAPKVFQICDGVFSLDKDIADRVVLN